MQGKTVEIKVIVETGGASKELRELADSFKDLSAAAEKSSKGVDLAAKSTKRIEENVGRLTKAYSALTNTIRGLITAYAAYRAVLAARQVIEVADAYQRLEARIRSVTASVREFQQAKERVYQIAQHVRAPLEVVGELYSRIALATQHLGLTQKQLGDVVQTLIEGFKVYGLTAEEAASASLQLSQAFARGKLQGDEFRSVFENFPVLMDYIAKAMGVAREELQKYAEQGKITSEVMIKAIQMMKDPIERTFMGLPVTLSEAFTSVKNSFMSLIGETIKQTHAFDELKASILGFASALTHIHLSELLGAFKYVTQLLPFVIKLFIRLAGAVEMVGAVIKRVFASIKVTILLFKAGWYSFVRAFWIGVQKMLDVVAKLRHVPMFRKIGGWAYQASQNIQGQLDSLTQVKEQALAEVGKTLKEIGGLKDLWNEWKKIWNSTGKALDAFDKAYKQALENFKKASQQAQTGAQNAAKSVKKSNELTDEQREKLRQLQLEWQKLTSYALPEHERAIKAVELKYQELEERVRKLGKQLGYSQEEINKWVALLEKRKQEEINKLRQKWLEDERKAALKDLEVHKTLLDKIKDLWSNLYEDLSNILVRWIEQGKLKFEDLLNYFKSMIARMVSYWIMGTMQMEMAGLVFVPSVGVVPASQASRLGIKGISPFQYGTGMLSKSLGKVFGLPTSLLESIYYETGWDWLGSVVEFMQNNPWLSAGVTGFIGGLLTGDVKKAALSGVGAGLGYALTGSPLGAAVGGFLSGIAAGVFGHHKKPKKPRLYVFQDAAEFTLEQFYEAYEEGIEYLKELLRTDVDHTKHSKEAAYKVAQAVGDLMKQMFDPWLDFAKQLDTLFDTQFAEFLKEYELSFEQVKLKSRKHLSEKFDKWMKEELPKLVETQLIDAFKDYFEAFVADKDKFESWINEWKQKIEQAKGAEEVAKVLEDFQKDIEQTFSAVVKITDWMKAYIGDVGKQVLSLILEAEKQYSLLEQRGLMNEQFKQKWLEYVQGQIDLILNAQFGFIKGYTIQIERFKYLYTDLWNIIEQSNIGWQGLLYVLTHIADYIDYLSQLAQQSGVSVEQLIAELADLSKAMYDASMAAFDAARSMVSLAIRLGQLGVFTPEQTHEAALYELWKEFAALQNVLVNETVRQQLQYIITSYQAFSQWVSQLTLPDIGSLIGWLAQIYGGEQNIPQQLLTALMDLAEWLKSINDYQQQQAENTQQIADNTQNTYRTIKNTYNELCQLRKAIESKISDLFGTYATIPESWAFAQRHYATLFERALSGNKEAINEYLSYVDKYLSIAQKYIASPFAFSRIFYQVIRDLYKIEGLFPADVCERIAEGIGDLNETVENWYNDWQRTTQGQGAGSYNFGGTGTVGISGRQQTTPSGAPGFRPEAGWGTEKWRNWINDLYDEILKAGKDWLSKQGTKVDFYKLLAYRSVAELIRTGMAKSWEEAVKIARNWMLQRNPEEIFGKGQEWFGKVMLQLTDTARKAYGFLVHVSSFLAGVPEPYWVHQYLGIGQPPFAAVGLAEDRPEAISAYNQPWGGSQIFYAHTAGQQLLNFIRTGQLPSWIQNPVQWGIGRIQQLNIAGVTPQALRQAGWTEEEIDLIRQYGYAVQDASETATQSLNQYSNAVDAATGAITNFVNTIVHAAQKVASQASGAFPETTVSTGGYYTGSSTGSSAFGGFHFTPLGSTEYGQTIFGLQTGGVATKPTLTLIGEGGQAEAVVPLPYGRRTLDILFEEMRSLKLENKILLEETVALRKDLNQINYQLLLEARKIRKLEEKWDAIGLPPHQS